MSMVVGLATVMALLKTQGVMMQFSYASMGARNTRKLGGQFMNGVSYMTSKGAGAAKAVSGKVANRGGAQGSSKASGRRAGTQSSGYTQPKSTQQGGGVKVTRIPAESKAKTGTTYEAPKVTPRDISYTKGTEPGRSNKKDKTL